MKKMFWIFVLVAAFLIPTKVSAVDLKLTYKEDLKECYDEPFSYVFPSYDNSGNFDGHLFLGENRMFKLDLNNKVVWKKSDGGIYKHLDFSSEINNTTGRLSIVIYDDNHNAIFKTEYVGSGSLRLVNRSFNDKNEHDGYIMLIVSDSIGLGVEPGFILVKFDLKGNLIWQKNVNGVLRPFGEARGFFPNFSDKNNFFTITVWDDSIEKTDKNGDSVWEKKIDIDILSSNYSYNSSGVIDGTVVVGSDSGVGKGIIIKYDLDGNEVFRNGYDNAGYIDVISSRTVDGTYDGYIVAAVGADAELTNIENVIIKYDYSGDIVWKDGFSTDAKVPMFFIGQNYDNSGNPNGYLFYPMEYMDDTNETCGYTLFKYTYPNYEIKKDITDEGDITVSDSAYPGDTVKVKVTPKEGYVLKRIVVLDESGKEIEVSDDGTFVMPEGKVTVTAIYNRISNPETVSACYVVLGIILLISIGTLIVSKKKEA